jgi:hypothetical protein
MLEAEIFLWISMRSKIQAKLQKKNVGCIAISQQLQLAACSPHSKFEV